jgi:branched-chain amino acid transport system ATP-binding protein
MLLEAREVEGGYGNLTILHGVTIQAQAGKITCIIGPNGAGKSTFLKTVFGFLKPKSGRITLDGDDITGLDPDRVLAKGAAYVLQGRSVFARMSVLENLQLGAYTRRGDPRITADMARVFQMFPILGKRRSQLAGTLSGGEQRMLELGRVMMLNPRLLLLDEPSIGLSPVHAEEVYDTLVSLRAAGLTILMVEQNVRRALSLADYAYVLDLGRNRLEGSGAWLLTNDEVARLYLGRR